MEIDHSAASAFRECPYKYYEQYMRNGTGIERIKPKDEPYGPLALGSRVHELLEEHHLFWPGVVKYLPSVDEALEAESQWIMAAYRKQYPEEDFEVLDVERVFRVQLPNSEHILTGKMDLFVQMLDSGLYRIMDHKTEKRGSKSNTPQKWAARDQASLYLWAAAKIYGEPIDRFVVNVLTRPSPAGQIGPTFPERQLLERSEHQIEIAIRDIIWTADDIERTRKVFGKGEWPSDREKCIGAFGQCPYYEIHTYGVSDELLAHHYEPKQPYLQIEGVKLI